MPPCFRVSILLSASAQLLPFGTVALCSLFAFSGLKNNRPSVGSRAAQVDYLYLTKSTLSHIVTIVNP